MTHIHYKFSSKLNYDTVVFDRLHVTLKDLKRQIMVREKLRAGDCDLQITNAQSKEEYESEECSIPKGSSVIVRRIPVIGAKSSSSKTRHSERVDVQTHQAFGAYKAQMDDQSSSRALPFFSKMANLADVEGSEEDKIKVMMNQSTYGTMNYNKKFCTVLPANYTCYRCGTTGHHIRNCPVNGDKNFQAPTRIKKSTGIPRSFMVEVDDPNTKGAMLTSSGRYAVSTIDSEAYAIGKKERPPFLPQEQLESEEEEDPVSEELLCLICRDMLSDAVVIPCCGNSYCDDCIRNALLDSEDHVCPTCSRPDVSPDNLIANKFLRQAVDNFKKEQGYFKSLKRGCGTSQSQNPTPSPVPPPPLLSVQSQPRKPPLSTNSQQDPLLHRSQAADTPPVSLVCVAPPTVTDPASSPSTLSTSLQPAQSHLEDPDKEDEEKTSDDSAAAAATSVPVSPKDPTDAPAQLIPLVNLTPLMEPPQTVGVNLEPPSSVPAPEPSAPSKFWESSSSSSSLCPTGGWNESNNQKLPPSVSSYPATPPPPLFPSPHFHTFLAAQQPLGSYPPGYPPPPLWALPNLQGSPIPALLPSASIPALIPSEWFQHQRKKKERTPHRGSSHRRSSSRSDSKSSKFKPSRSYSRSSSRSRSRSRSRSHGRSRPHSPYSRHRDLHSRSRSSRSYTFGYKRSPTPSSSSSPRVGYHSRPKSPSDHRKSGHHSRHHSKKSASSSYNSRRRGEHKQREAGAPGGSLPGHLYAQHANQSGSLELDRERYLQWNSEYKEWCDKYFSSYVGHFHQLPIPLLNIPPPPQWGDREGSGNASRARSDPRSRLQGRRAARMEGRSPPSQSSSDSRSPPSQSSRDSRSTLSQSSSDSRSSTSRSSNESRSPPSRSSGDGCSTPSKDVAQPRAYQKKCTERANRQSVTLTKDSKEVELQESREDEKQAIAKNLENLGTVKHEQKKEHEEGGEEESSSPEAADSTNDCRKDKRRHSSGPNAFKDGTPAQDEATTSNALESVQPLAKPDKRLDKDYKRKSREHRTLEMEKGRRRGKHSDSRQDVGRRHKEKPSKEPDMVDTDRYPGGSTASDSRSERNRKRKGEDIKRSSLKVENSKCLKTNTADDPKARRSESPNPFDRKKPNMENKKERKTWPLTERDIWEGGIRVKPQKKISININLDGNRKEEKTEKQPFSYLEKTKEEIEKPSNGEKEKLNEETDIEDNEKKESSRDVEGVSGEKIKPDEGDARQKWEKATFRDDEGEMLEKKDIGEKKDDFDLWHSALGEEEEKTKESKKQGDERDAMEASKGEDLIDERGGQEGQAMAESTGEENRGNLPGESKEDLVEGVKWRMWEEEEEEEEEDTVGSKSQRSRNESHQDGANSSVVDGSSYGDRQEKKTVVKALEEYTEDELVLIQVPRSKWGKEESVEEERDEGMTEAQMDTLASSLPSSSVSVTSETTTNRETQNEEKRERSVERERGRERVRTPVLLSSHQRVAPSSGKDRNDSTAYSDRHRERRRDRERERPRDKESKRSKERAREGEKGRDREREREHSSVASAQKRNPPSSSHSYSHSKSHDTERRDGQRGGDPGDTKSSPRLSRKYSGGRRRESRATELPDQNTHKSCRGALLDSKFKDKDPPQYYHNHQDPPGNSRHQERPAGSHHSPPSRSHSRSKERDPSSTAPEFMQNRSRNESRVEKEEWKPRQVKKDGETVSQEMVAVRAGGGRWEDEGLDGRTKWAATTRELEEGERPSSVSVSSSASQEDDGDDGRKLKKEKRHAAPEVLLEDGELKKTTSREETSSGEVDGHAKLHSATLS